jgi:hypothetical protein
MTDHRSRRWFQLSLKSLFLLMLLVATFFAGYSLATKQAEAERKRAELEGQRQAEEARLQDIAVGDFDSDGLLDIVVTQPQGPAVFRNLGGGKFQDVTGQAGLGR